MLDSHFLSSRALDNTRLSFVEIPKFLNGVFGELYRCMVYYAGLGIIGLMS